MYLYDLYLKPNNLADIIKDIQFIPLSKPLPEIMDGFKESKQSICIVLDKDKKLIEEYLHKTGGKALSIPYRENRDVIFKSELFHQSDVVNFKSGYENHRINITMVFGYGDLI